METTRPKRHRPPDSSSRDDIRRLRLHLGRLGLAIGELEAEDRLSPSVAVSIRRLRSLFGNSPELRVRTFLLAAGWPAAVIYLDGLVDDVRVEYSLIRSLQDGGRLDIPAPGLGPVPPGPAFVSEVLASVNQIPPVSDYRNAIQRVLSGSTLLLVEGWEQSLVFQIRQVSTRSIEEPQTEAVVRGPREGLVEDIETNLALIRRRLRDHRLRQADFNLGERTRTRVVVLFLADVANTALVDEVMARLGRIEIEGVVESSYVEELIEDNPFSLFPQLLYTERPDAAVGHLLEGRVVILTDGTPIALVAPTALWSMMHASEDYYERFWVSSAIRLLRLFFLGIALLLPSFYIAVTTFHQEMMPTPLLFQVAAAREGIPFPAFVEALIMEVSFEILREAGIRLPKVIGQAVSIVGALVIGQAAVQAGIVSAPMVIIVALTGVASFAIPHFNLAIAIRVLRFPLMALAAVLGLYGIMLGLLAILAHLCSLRSFGLPYLAPLAPFQLSDLKDALVRLPHWYQTHRPLEVEPTDLRRRGSDLQPSPPAAHPTTGIGRQLEREEES